MDSLSKFYNDPEWHIVEAYFSKQAEALRDILDIDVSQSAETVKAEVIARQHSHKALVNFLENFKIADRRTDKPFSFR